MNKVVAELRNVLRFHKSKIAWLLFSMMAFLFILFPYGDLGGWVATKVTQWTDNQVYLQFEDLGFSFKPQLGVEMEDVFLQTPFLPALKMDSLFAAPSFLGLVTFNPAFTLIAEGFWGGSVHFSSSGSKKNEREVLVHRFKLSLEEVALGKIQEFFELPFSFQGKLLGSTHLAVDLEFGEQPQGDLSMDVVGFRMPPSSIDTQMGPVTLPHVEVSQVSVRGRLNQGELFIEEAQLGSSKDQLYGEIKGKWGVSFRRKGTEVSPIFGAYELKIDLNVAQALHKEMELLFFLMDSCKNTTTTGVRYLCKISGTGGGRPPRFSSINSI